MKDLNVVIASDDNYIEFVAICLKSLFCTNKDFNRVRIFLLSNFLSEKSIKEVDFVIPDDIGELNVIPINDISEKLQIQVPNTIAITSYARLFMASLLPCDVDRVLYVDCDVIFNGSIVDFYDVDFGDNWLVGVLDTCMSNKVKQSIDIADDDIYLNAGVLMIPLAKWREINIEKKFIDFLLLKEGNVYHHDQGILNAVCNKKKMYVHPKYNLSSYYLSHNYRLLYKNNIPFYAKEEVAEAKKNPIIIHYTSGYYNRPWEFNCRHPYKNTFLYYKAQTDYKLSPLRKHKRKKLDEIFACVFLYCPYFIYKFCEYIRYIAWKLFK